MIGITLPAFILWRAVVDEEKLFREDLSMVHAAGSSWICGREPYMVSPMHDDSFFLTKCSVRS